MRCKSGTKWAWEPLGPCPHKNPYHTSEINLASTRWCTPLTLVISTIHHSEASSMSTERYLGTHHPFLEHPEHHLSRALFQVPSGFVSGWAPPMPWCFRRWFKILCHCGSIRMPLRYQTRCSMYGICAYIYPQNGPNVGK